MMDAAQFMERQKQKNYRGWRYRPKPNMMPTEYIGGPNPKLRRDLTMNPDSVQQQHGRKATCQSAKAKKQQLERPVAPAVGHQVAAV
jgi:hypothetical protein